jgi:hypothetical protein
MRECDEWERAMRDIKEISMGRSVRLVGDSIHINYIID